MDFSPSHFFGMNFGGSRMKCLLRERERVCTIYSILNHNLMSELSSVKFFVLKFDQKWQFYQDRVKKKKVIWIVRCVRT